MIRANPSENSAYTVTSHNKNLDVNFTEFPENNGLLGSSEDGKLIIVDDCDKNASGDLTGTYPNPTVSGTSGYKFRLTPTEKYSTSGTYEHFGGALKLKANCFGHEVKVSEQKNNNFDDVFVEKQLSNGELVRTFNADHYSYFEQESAINHIEINSSGERQIVYNEGNAVKVRNFYYPFGIGEGYTSRKKADLNFALGVNEEQLNFDLKKFEEYYIKNNLDSSQRILNLHGNLNNYTPYKIKDTVHSIEEGITQISSSDIIYILYSINTTGLYYDSYNSLPILENVDKTTATKYYMKKTSSTNVSVYSDSACTTQVFSGTITQMSDLYYSESLGTHKNTATSELDVIVKIHPYLGEFEKIYFTLNGTVSYFQVEEYGYVKEYYTSNSSQYKIEYDSTLSSLNYTLSKMVNGSYSIINKNETGFISCTFIDFYKTYLNTELLSKTFTDSEIIDLFYYFNKEYPGTVLVNLLPGYGAVGNNRFDYSWREGISNTVLLQTLQYNSYCLKNDNFATNYKYIINIIGDETKTKEYYSSNPPDFSKEIIEIKANETNTSADSKFVTDDGKTYLVLANSFHNGLSLIHQSKDYATDVTKCSKMTKLTQEVVTKVDCNPTITITRERNESDNLTYKASVVYYTYSKINTVITYYKICSEAILENIETGYFSPIVALIGINDAKNLSFGCFSCGDELPLIKSNYIYNESLLSDSNNLKYCSYNKHEIINISDYYNTKGEVFKIVEDATNKKIKLIKSSYPSTYSYTTSANHIVLNNNTITPSSDYQDYSIEIYDDESTISTTKLTTNIKSIFIERTYSTEYYIEIYFNEYTNIQKIIEFPQYVLSSYDTRNYQIKDGTFFVLDDGVLKYTNPITSSVFSFPSTLENKNIKSISEIFFGNITKTSEQNGTILDEDSAYTNAILFYVLYSDKISTIVIPINDNTFSFESEMIDIRDYTNQSKVTQNDTTRAYTRLFESISDISDISILYGTQDETDCVYGVCYSNQELFILNNRNGTIESSLINLYKNSSDAENSIAFENSTKYNKIVCESFCISGSIILYSNILDINPIFLEIDFSEFSKPAYLDEKTSYTTKGYIYNKKENDSFEKTFNTIYNNTETIGLISQMSNPARLDRRSVENNTICEASINSNSTNQYDLMKLEKHTIPIHGNVNFYRSAPNEIYTRKTSETSPLYISGNNIVELKPTTLSASGIELTDGVYTKSNDSESNVLERKIIISDDESYYYILLCYSKDTNSNTFWMRIQ